jgi:acetyl esterase/lipase
VIFRCRRGRCRFDPSLYSLRHPLDAYHIPGTKQPALVIIHGGYWYQDDKSSCVATSQWYAERGYAVFSLNYRLNAQSGWTAQRTDALNAIAWVKARAAQFSTDPNRVLLLGSSAGGQIATAVGTYGTGTIYVRGVVTLSPVASPYRAYGDGHESGTSTSKQKLRGKSTLLARCYPIKTDTPCWNRWTDAVVNWRRCSIRIVLYPQAGRCRGWCGGVGGFDLVGSAVAAP